MASSHTFQWDPIMALVGPATHSVSIACGSTDGTIPFVSGAETTFIREILVGGTADGNLRCKFLHDTATSVTIPVKAGQRYPWALTKVFATGTTATKIWGFY
jgi:hypothetical protein